MWSKNRVPLWWRLRKCIWDSQPIINFYKLQEYPFEANDLIFSTVIKPLLCILLGILHALKACNSTPWVTEGAKDIMSDSWEWWRNSFPWLTHGIFPWIALFSPRQYYNHWTSAGRVTCFYLWSLVVSVSLIDAYFATHHCQNIIFCKKFIKADDYWAPTHGSYLIASIKPAIWLFCSCFLMLSPAHIHYLYSICKRLLWKSQAIPPCNSLKYFTHQTLQTYSQFTESQ